MRVFRNVMVCYDCWDKHMPGREAVRVLGEPLTHECLVCQEPTGSLGVQGRRVFGRR